MRFKCEDGIDSYCGKCHSNTIILRVIHCVIESAFRLRTIRHLSRKLEDKYPQSVKVYLHKTC